MRNFRVLRDVEIRNLTPLTVFLGPNGSGKSTFFDVFAFLSDCLSLNLNRAIASRSGVGLRDLRSRDSEGPITIELAYRDGYTGKKPYLITYHIEIDEEDGRPIVAKEWMRSQHGPSGPPLRLLNYIKGEGNVSTGESLPARDHWTTQALISPDVLAVSTFGRLRENPRIHALLDFITGWHLSHLSANDMRSQPIAGAQERLSPSGDNLANVVQYLADNHPERLEKIFVALRRRVPRIDRIDAQMDRSGRLLLMLKDKPFGESIQARYASEGTMKLLAYLVQLYDPNSPPLIGIEEPENFLHPALLAELAEECEQATAHTQLIVTTHSPFFIDHLDAKQVHALSRGEDGYTVVKCVANMRGIPEMLETGSSLGDLWMSNFFEYSSP